MSRKCIKQTSEKTSLLVVKDYNLLKGSRIIILEKSKSKELYSLLISAIHYQPTSQNYFVYFVYYNLFSNIELPWKEIYLTVRKATANSHLRCFSYELLTMCFI